MRRGVQRAGGSKCRGYGVQGRGALAEGQPVAPEGLLSQEEALVSHSTAGNAESRGQ